MLSAWLRFPSRVPADWRTHVEWIDRHARSCDRFFDARLAPRAGSMYQMLRLVHQVDGDWSGPSLGPALAEAVAEVRAKRREDAQPEESPTRSARRASWAAMPSGCWLWFFPELAEFSQMAIGETLLVDEADAPAWEFWVAAGRLHFPADPQVHDRLCLLSWIPKHKAPEIDLAVRVSVISALAWAVQPPPGFALRET